MSYMAYIGREKCGCITFACVDNPEHAEDTARNVAEALRGGLTIERVDGEVVKTSFSVCPLDPAKRWKYRVCKPNVCVMQKLGLAVA